MLAFFIYLSCIHLAIADNGDYVNYDCIWYTIKNRKNSPRAL